MDAAKIGALIAQQRRKLGMTQAELAERIGVTNKAISRWETGRGYPDIELIPDLAKILGVSISDLLNGEISENADKNVQAYESISDICVYAGTQRRKLSRLIVFLIAVLSAILFGLMALIVTIQWKSVYNAVIGNESCVVAADYHSLTYMGNEYIPLPMNGCECVIGDQILSEVRVEGVGFLSKLFFGDALFEVENVLCDEIVYLQTDYDGLISEYYVLVDRFDFYAGLLETPFVSYWAVGENANGYEWERHLNESAASVISNPLEEVRINYSRGVNIRAYEENHIFFYRYGEVIRYNGDYFWMPYEFVDDGFVHSGYYISNRYYRLDGAHKEVFDDYFAMLE